MSENKKEKGERMMKTDCPCCNARRWHCEDCWNKYHNGLRDKDWIPPRYPNQPLFDYPEQGRFKAGNHASHIAVCSLATVEMELPMDKIAMLGKCVTENTGIEKMIKNILANPNITHLICCGKESRGHFITDALMCLKEHGVNEKDEIIGAKGAMPIVSKLLPSEIKQFREKITIVDLANELNENNIIAEIDKLCPKTPKEKGEVNG